ncbi:hypothetical protein Hypma_003352 [Hypsizygus marmoreus]|uniref:Uncharacterized protein n=1 Tax=Hypsizygus marmoreus TaxID=39966 RepID=A0A369J2A0_HYPMA|nr:hypothetical protein Hypma_003352 [Hypsizygus marmoreus]
MAHSHSRVLRWQYSVGRDTVQRIVKEFIPAWTEGLRDLPQKTFPMGIIITPMKGFPIGYKYFLRGQQSSAAYLCLYALTLLQPNRRFLLQHRRAPNAQVSYPRVQYLKDNLTSHENLISVSRSAVLCTESNCFLPGEISQPKHDLKNNVDVHILVYNELLDDVPASTPTERDPHRRRHDDVRLLAAPTWQEDDERAETGRARPGGFKARARKETDIIADNEKVKQDSRNKAERSGPCNTSSSGSSCDEVPYPPLSHRIISNPALAFRFLFLKFPFTSMTDDGSDAAFSCIVVLLLLYAPSLIPLPLSFHPLHPHSLSTHPPSQCPSLKIAAKNTTGAAEPAHPAKS